MVQSNFEFPLFSYQVTGASWHDSMNTASENKNPRMQIRFRKYKLDLWIMIRKYHKYDKIDRKTRNCDIFSIECQKFDGNT